MAATLAVVLPLVKTLSTTIKVAKANDEQSKRLLRLAERLAAWLQQLAPPVVELLERDGTLEEFRGVLQAAVKLTNSFRSPAPAWQRLVAFVHRKDKLETLNRRMSDIMQETTMRCAAASAGNIGASAPPSLLQSAADASRERRDWASAGRSDDLDAAVAVLANTPAATRLHETLPDADGSVEAQVDRAVRCVIQAMRETVFDIPAQMNVALALAMLSAHTSNCQRLVALGGAEAALECMARNAEHHWEPDLQCMCMWALANMASQPQHAQHLAAVGCVAGALQALHNAHQHTPWECSVPAYACRALANLSACPLVCREMLEAGASAAVVRVVADLSSEPDRPDKVWKNNAPNTLAMACMALTNLMANGPKGADSLAMREGSRGSECDGFVLVDCSDGAQAVAAAGGLAVILQALRMHGDRNPAVARHGCAALLALCQGGCASARVELQQAELGFEMGELLATFEAGGCWARHESGGPPGAEEEGGEDCAPECDAEVVVVSMGDGSGEQDDSNMQAAAQKEARRLRRFLADVDAAKPSVRVLSRRTSSLRQRRDDGAGKESEHDHIEGPARRQSRGRGSVSSEPSKCVATPQGTLTLL